MNGKVTPKQLISPYEAITVFKYTRLQHVLFARDLLEAYRNCYGSDTKSEWGLIKLMTFAYTSGRIQGIREERKKKTEKAT